MPATPTGTITFLFTDIEGSTRLWEQFPAPMQRALSRHDDLLRQAIEQNQGYVFKTVGDAFCAAFSTAPAALAATVAIQQALANEPWPTEIGQIKVRMGLHTGVAEKREGDYFGQTLNRVARLQGVAYGGQVLLSNVTKELINSLLPESFSLVDLGEHRLKDLTNPEQLFQLVIPGLNSEFPPLKTIGTYPNNLPLPTTSFIGREKEIAEIKELLAKSRLVTLTGVGGTGKTRLSQAVAEEVLTEFKDGVCLVELAPLSDSSLVIQEVSQVLKVSEKPGQPMLATIIERLKSSQLLLILDNCEHLIEGCANLSGGLLANCPNLKILATSREGLNVRGEKVYRVPSLGVPPAITQTQPLNSSENLVKYESVRLFVERAEVANQQFNLNERNSKAVAEICRRLDGIPLALELAAVRVKSLGVEQIAEKLIDRFRLLTTGNRNDLPRQQTLRALIDWSYDLLSEPEKVLWQRLSVFAGGWTLEAAEAVCARAPIEEWEVLDLLSQLVDKSLVVAEEQASSQIRYQMLETIREYGREKLDERGQTETLKQQMISYFREFIERVEPHLYRPERKTWLAKVVEDYDNIRIALTWSLTNPANSLQLAASLGWFWYHKSYYREGIGWLEEILNNNPAPSPARAKALHGLGQLYFYFNNFEKAQLHLEESISLWRQYNDKSGLAFALLYLTITFCASGKKERHFQEARSLFQEVGDEWGYAVNLFYQGSEKILYHALEPELVRLGALELEESLKTFRQMEDYWSIGGVLLYLSPIAIREKNFSKARTLLEESIRMFENEGDIYRIQTGIQWLCQVAFYQKSYQEVVNLCQKGLNLNQSRSRETLALFITTLGFAQLFQSKFEQANEVFYELLNLPIKPQKNFLSFGFAGFAGVATAKGDHLFAAKLYGLASSFTEDMVIALPEYIGEVFKPKYLDETIAVLGKEAYDGAFAEGQAMSLEEAIDFALHIPSADKL